ncbi:hypothetical protein Q664_24215 [Archangium violaceum Cb vi76]|uniref:Type I restriction enzyme HindI endonuclease subunit-like C-terminal domain-containing protein n=1 Tax=Archangium violaceum Cb vi76 TaxID=1406225 RepID=A0A084SRP8_9BACT|nr:hypothetical protein Q664_24215 [Archangium violaceum Cb vi76]
MVNAKRSRGGIAPRERLRGRDIRVKSQFRIETDDFLISKRQIIHGACGVVPKELSGSIVSNEYVSLRPKSSLNIDYLRHLSFTSYFQACVSLLEPEDVRATFDQAFRAFSESLDMLLPDPRALPYVDDLRWLGKIRAAARARFRDRSLDLGDCGAKVRQLIEESVTAEGIQILVKEVSLFGREFEEKLEALKTPEARASEMEHALRHEIHVRLEETPAFYTSLRERLEQIIADRKLQRIDDARQLELLQGLRAEARDEQGAAQKIGLSEFAFAIYGVLEEGPLPQAGEPDIVYDESRKELASIIQEAIDPSTDIIDWATKEDVQREMRQSIKKRLRAARFGDPAKVEAATARIMDLARARRKR